MAQFHGLRLKNGCLDANPFTNECLKNDTNKKQLNATNYELKKCDLR